MRTTPLILAAFWLGAALPALSAQPPILHIEGRTYRSARDGAYLVLIPAGELRQGDPAGRYDEKPPRRVRLDAFLIDRDEVTNAMFERFVAASSYRPRGPWRRGYPEDGGSLPVRFVTWHDARAYAHWAGRRLPTEAEWEAACGPERFPWGDRWTNGRAVTGRPVAAGPVPPGTSGDVALSGVRDLAGNVREWCYDWYDRFAYQASAGGAVLVNPRGPADGTPPEEKYVLSGTATGNERSTRKVVRGASWPALNGPEQCRRSRRGAHDPEEWFADVGFRCALDFQERGP